MPLSVPPTTRVASPDPVDYGWLAWAYDIANPSIGVALTTAGTMYGCRLYLAKAATVTNIVTYLSVAGATLTSAQCKAAIFDSAGALQGTTVDQASAWASTGFKTMALATPVVLAPGLYDVAAWFNGTTGPTLVRAAGIASIQSGTSGQNLRFFSADTGRTTTAPSTLGTKSTLNTSWWLALS